MVTDVIGVDVKIRSKASQSSFRKEPLYLEQSSSTLPLGGIGVGNLSTIVGVDIMCYAM